MKLGWLLQNPHLWTHMKVRYSVNNLPTSSALLKHYPKFPHHQHNMKTLQQLIKEKKLGYVNSDVTDENFPFVERKVGEYKLFHFDRFISSEDAIAEMEKEGYLPANAHELLLWKDWNEKDFVVALGSVAEVDGHRGVPYLSRSGSMRFLDLIWFGGDWSSGYRFLAVRNSQTHESVISNSVD